MIKVIIHRCPARDKRKDCAYAHGAVDKPSSE